MLPKSWKPVPAQGLFRLGPQADGGYVVAAASVGATDILVSMGLNDDWRFEKAFLAASGARVICFDHSVDARFWVLYALKNVVRLRAAAALRYVSYRRFFRGRAEHRRQRIGNGRVGEVSLTQILAEVGQQSIFLKVDIEGSEYRILDEVIQNAARFTGMVFEFHDIDLHRARVERFLTELSGFAVIDFSGNNFGGVDALGDPRVIEISLCADRYLERRNGGPDWVSAAVRNDPQQPAIGLEFAD